MAAPSTSSIGATGNEQRGAKSPPSFMPKYPAGVRGREAPGGAQAETGIRASIMPAYQLAPAGIALSSKS